MREWAADWEVLKSTDPEIAEAIQGELERERSTVRLIASENYASPAVLAALANPMNDKYAEGYPGRRYYGGCRWVDVAETLAIERAKELFGAEHANVQPHAGAQANMAAYFAFMEPGDTLLGMSLPHGGHLTHGSPVNFSGKWFNVVGYEVDKETELIDLDQVRDLAREHRPRMIVAGATAYPRTIDFAAFRQIADEVGAVFLVDAAHFIGLVAGGAFPDPVPHADVVTFTGRSSPCCREDPWSTASRPRPWPSRRPCSLSSGSTLTGWCAPRGPWPTGSGRRASAWSPGAPIPTWRSSTCSPSG